MKRFRRLFLVAGGMIAVGLVLATIVFRRTLDAGNNRNSSLDSDVSGRSQWDHFKGRSGEQPGSEPDRGLGNTRVANVPTTGQSTNSTERIMALYASLSQDELQRLNGRPHPKVIEILVEGMDPLSAARFLKKTAYHEYALLYAEMALAENPDSFDALLVRTQLIPLVPPGREEERTAAARRLVELNPSSAEARLELAVMIFMDSPKEALEHLNIARNLDPSDHRIYGSLGETYERLGEYANAVKAYETALRLDPDSRESYLRGSIRDIQAGKPGIPKFVEKRTSTDDSEKQDTFRSEPAPDSINPDNSVDRQSSERTTPRPSETNRPSNERRVEKPRVPPGLENLAEDYFALFGENFAIPDELRSDFAANPSDPALLYLGLARAYVKAGRPDQASLIYERASERYPNDPRIRDDLKQLQNTSRDPKRQRNR